MLDLSQFTSHTPGPWGIESLWRIVSPDPWRHAEDVANARLIAAAPDLLEEVKRLRRILVACADAAGAGVSPDASIEFLAQIPCEIRCAIKEAEAYD